MLRQDARARAGRLRCSIPEVVRLERLTVGNHSLANRGGRLHSVGQLAGELGEQRLRIADGGDGRGRIGTGSDVQQRRD